MKLANKIITTYLLNIDGILQMVYLNLITKDFIQKRTTCTMY